MEKTGYRTKLKIGEGSSVREVEGKSGKVKVMDFLATNPEGQAAKYGIFAKAELFPYIKPGETIDCDVNDTPRKDGQGVNRNVVQIYVDDKPVIEQKKVWSGGYQREDPVLKRRSYALSYSKDLCVSGKIELTQIIPQAKIFDDWLGAGTVSIPTSTPETKATATPKAENSTQQPSPPLPASHSEVQRKLNHLIHENIWTVERAIKEMVDRGGVGKDSLEKIKSLKPDKLQELNQIIDNARGEKAKELFN